MFNFIQKLNEHEIENAEFVNLTPHPIVLQKGEETITIEPSGTTIRVEMGRNEVGTINGFPLSELYVKNIVGLPNPKPNTYYIVSAIVASNVKDRPDVVAPDTDAANRNEKGHIVSVPGFVRYS